MARKYYSVLSQEPGQPHVIEYGSYDKQDCKDEIESLANDAWREDRTALFQIITTDDTQAAINAKVSELNQ